MGQHMDMMNADSGMDLNLICITGKKTNNEKQSQALWDRDLADCPRKQCPLQSAAGQGVKTYFGP